MSVHYRVIFILHRQVGTAGTNRCRQMCAASTGEQGKARTRTSSPENSSGESPVRAASLGSGSCRLCTLVASQQRFLRCSALAKSHGSLLVCSDSCCRAAARRHNTRSSTASPRGMLCPAGLLLRNKHAQTTTAHASQSQRGCRGAGKLQGEEERFWTHGCSLLFDFFTAACQYQDQCSLLCSVSLWRQTVRLWILRTFGSTECTPCRIVYCRTTLQITYKCSEMRDPLVPHSLGTVVLPPGGNPVA